MGKIRRVSPESLPYPSWGKKFLLSGKNERDLVKKWQVIVNKREIWGVGPNNGFGIKGFFVGKLKEHITAR